MKKEFRLQTDPDFEKHWQKVLDENRQLRSQLQAAQAHAIELSGEAQLSKMHFTECRLLLESAEARALGLEKQIAELNESYRKLQTKNEEIEQEKRAICKNMAALDLVKGVLGELKSVQAAGAPQQPQQNEPAPIVVTDALGAPSVTGVIDTMTAAQSSSENEETVALQAKIRFQEERIGDLEKTKQSLWDELVESERIRAELKKEIVELRSAWGNAQLSIQAQAASARVTEPPVSKEISDEYLRLLQEASLKDDQIERLRHELLKQKAGAV